MLIIVAGIALFFCAFHKEFCLEGCALRLLSALPVREGRVWAAWTHGGQRGLPWAAWKLIRVQHWWESSPQFAHFGDLQGLEEFLPQYQMPQESIICIQTWIFFSVRDERDRKACWQGGGLQLFGTASVGVLWRLPPGRFCLYCVKWPVGAGGSRLFATKVSQAVVRAQGLGTSGLGWLWLGVSQLPLFPSLSLPTFLALIIQRQMHNSYTRIRVIWTWGSEYRSFLHEHFVSEEKHSG